MSSLTNMINMILSVRGPRHIPPPAITLTRDQISDILETTFNKRTFLKWHRKKQRWIRTTAQCSPTWLNHLKTLITNVGDHLLAATHKGDLLAFWTDNLVSFPVRHHATPRALVNSALDSVRYALAEFRILAADLAAFMAQPDAIRWTFYDYLKQVLAYAIVLMRLCSPPPAPDDDDHKTWLDYQEASLEFLEHDFRFDSMQASWRSVEKQGDRSLNGVIPPSDKMLPNFFAGKPTYPCFVRQEGVYGKRLVKIEWVLEDWAINKEDVKACLV